MKCHKCGKKIDDNSVFCEYCGVPVEKSNSITPLWITLAAFMAICAVVVCIIGIMAYFQNRQQSLQAELLEQHPKEEISLQIGDKTPEDKTEPSPSPKEITTPHVKNVVDAAPSKTVTKEEPTQQSPSETNVEEENDNRVLDVPEESAAFPGDVYDWLNRNIKYPPICQEQGIQGRVSVQFVINKDGSIVDIKVLKSPDRNLSDEAVRVIQAMPKWKPAYQNNKPVRMRYVLPIMFRLS